MAGDLITAKSKVLETGNGGRNVPSLIVNGGPKFSYAKEKRRF
jgi:hypothetical protein